MKWNSQVSFKVLVLCLVLSCSSLPVASNTFILLNIFFIKNILINYILVMITPSWTPPRSFPPITHPTLSHFFLFLENSPDARNCEVHDCFMWFVKCQVIQSRRETLPRLSRCFHDIFKYTGEETKCSGLSLSHHFITTDIKYLDVVISWWWCWESATFSWNTLWSDGTHCWPWSQTGLSS